MLFHQRNASFCYYSEILQIQFFQRCVSKQNFRKPLYLSNEIIMDQKFRTPSSNFFPCHITSPSYNTPPQKFLIESNNTVVEKQINLAYIMKICKHGEHFNILPNSCFSLVGRFSNLLILHELF
jgi:hypothetical protein